MRLLLVFFVSLFFFGCASNYSVKESNFKSAIIQYSSDNALSFYKEEHINTIKKRLTSATADYVKKRGDLAVIPACEPGCVLVKADIKTLTLSGGDKSSKCDLKITGHYVECGTDKVLGTFYHSEEEQKQDEAFDAISRDMAVDLYKFINRYSLEHPMNTATNNKGK